MTMRLPGIKGKGEGGSLELTMFTSLHPKVKMHISYTVVLTLTKTLKKEFSNNQELLWLVDITLFL